MPDPPQWAQRLGIEKDVGVQIRIQPIRDRTVKPKVYHPGNGGDSHAAEKKETIGE